MSVDPFVDKIWPDDCFWPDIGQSSFLERENNGMKYILELNILFNISLRITPCRRGMQWPFMQVR